ncbi:CAAX protease [Geobacillus subterraneus]|uniref:CAAX protease n=2 Tax=Geobacillus TaxID=129337 RepID=A0ABN4NEQ0_9BACL|nr:MULTISPECIES: CPBP family intramembrane glutamic endopeptidase [Geobacillus]AMX83066.1 CAAX protease [Geobacillus subterraneus]KZS27025.1 CAAX protease [Geobacillus subterraneus]OXB91160.1 CPBP family intramembrane metalloprotease [Geobacillus uzenensis]
MRRQSEQIQHMTDREVLFHLYLTQGLLLAVAGVASLFLFDWAEWRRLWRLDLSDVLLYGVGAAALVLAADFLAMRYLPEDWHDDGGVNEKIFRGRSILHLFFLCGLIAVTEEWLFRGIVQTHWGLWAASAIFAVLHVRYLEKWFLFLMVIVLSLFLGVLYERTGSLWVTVTAHFLIDFVLALHIRLGGETEEEGK